MGRDEEQIKSLAATSRGMPSMSISSRSARACAGTKSKTIDAVWLRTVLAAEGLDGVGKHRTSRT